MDTQQVVLLPVPLARALAVNPSLPISILISVTLAAQPVRLNKGDRLTAGAPEDVAVVRVMAIEAPTVPLVMVKLDVGVGVLKSAVHAQGFNIGYNIGRCAGAGLPDHLHAHIVPRWEGDTNFMPILGNVRVIPESIDALYTKMQKAAAELGLPPVGGS